MKEESRTFEWSLGKNTVDREKLIRLDRKVVFVKVFILGAPGWLSC